MCSESNFKNKDDSLFGRDHLVRGNGHKPTIFNKTLFAVLEGLTICLAYYILFTPLVYDILITYLPEMFRKRIQSISFLQSVFLFTTLTLNSLKSSYYVAFISHTDSMTFLATILVAGVIHPFLVLTLCLGAFDVSSHATLHWLMAGMGIFLMGFLFELLSDLELMAYKKHLTHQKQQCNLISVIDEYIGVDEGDHRIVANITDRDISTRRNTYELLHAQLGPSPVLLTTGFRALSRHPSYLFNIMLFQGIAICSGSLLMALGLFLYIELYIYHICIH